MLYDSNLYSEDEKRNIAFQTLVAIREATSIGKRVPTQIPYEDAFDILYDLYPEVYSHITELLLKKNKSEEVQLAIAKAEALSTLDEPIYPKDILKDELDEIDKALASKPKSRPLKIKKAKLISALEYFEMRTPSEHKILNRDFYLASRNNIINKELYRDEKRIDYKLANDRILRLRLLHPDNEEHIIGADMIYEQYDLTKEKVRFVHLQYKVWDRDTLYFSQGNLASQVDKLENLICKNEFCLNQDKVNHSIHYRLPFCSAFLRPTDKKQTADSSLNTTGLHTPVCLVQKLKAIEGKIKKADIKNNSIGHVIFEELFVNNMLGSRWMSFDELEQFYEKINIESNINTVRVHAQEVYIEPEYLKVQD